MASLWHLEKVNLFDAFCPHKFSEFSKDHTFREYANGDIIYFKQDPANTIYLIADGKVKIVHYLDDGTEVVKTILSKGEIFGESAILGETAHTDFAQSISKSTSLCTLSSEMVMQLMLNDKEFNLRIYKMIGWRIKKLERRISMLLHKNVRQRFLEFMYELSSENGEQVLDGILVHHNLTQQNIADLIGTTRQTLNSLIHELVKEGIIRCEKSKILLYNREVSATRHSITNPLNSLH